MAKKTSETPLMRQYNEIKTKHPDALLLFRVGDFYETFGQDAIKASKILDIVLTKRANGSSHIELAGFPHHSIDTYLPKLVRAGQRVAICDQLENPKLTKTIVKRGITELVTPGVTFSDHIVKNNSNNFLASVYISNKVYGIALCDVTTGEFLTAQGGGDYIQKLIQSFQPSEILYPKTNKAEYLELLSSKQFSFQLDDWVYQSTYAYELLTNQFETKKLKGFGIEDMEVGIIAAGSIIHYLKDTRHNKLDHISAISRVIEDEYVWMDQFTLRNLEIFNSNSPDGTSLLDVINQTSSPMGSRMLKRWLALPLKDEDAINKRLNIVEYFHSNSTYTTNVYNLVSQIGDLERLISKLSTGRILPREFQLIANSIEVVEEIKQVLQTSDNKDLKNLSKKLWDCDDLKSLIDKTIKESPSVLISKGDVIAFGVSDELDELRDLRSNGKNKLAEIQKREEELTGITSLKISFNNVFGYFLEVRNTHKDKVPESWIRKQTLVNAERYITEELKEYESKILGAEEKIQVIESKLYQELIEKSFAFISVLKQNAEGVAYLDCLSSLANFALKNNYKKPNVNTGREIKITGGRHPVIEQHLPPDNPYIDNDLLLNSETQQIIMITGPNMSGKSALLRQTALIVLLAQIGSFVPAKSAEIGIVDKIFVRVGASDNISQGESTFMVEMNETASILNNLSENSLVLLDEIGRGTSTYDGISIAWAIAEFLHQHPNKPNTLFATHYHELNEMTGIFPRIKNFNVSVKEIKNKIIFLRKLKEGGSEHSFGIHVAKMAGMPAFVLNKAGNILKKLEESRSDETNKEQITSGSESQLSFFQLDDPLLDEIKDTLNQLEINTLTPVEALMILNEMKGKLSG